VAKCVRIISEPTVDNSGTRPFYLDVPIDDDGTVVGKQALFGFQGKMNDPTDWSRPFVLYSDGKVDFGEAWEGNDQFGQTDLRNRSVRVGTILHWQGSGYDEQFRITRLVPLGEPSGD
jgi:hypothetical protein